MTGGSPLVVFQLALVAVGIIAWALAIGDWIIIVRARRRWLRLPATVERIQPRGRPWSGDVSAIEVRYEYRISGRRFQSSRLVPGRLSAIGYSSRTWVRTIRQVLSRGGPLMVYCNPRRPSESAITVDATEHVWFVFAVGTVLIGLSILVAWLALAS